MSGLPAPAPFLSQEAILEEMKAKVDDMWRDFKRRADRAPETPVGNLG